MRSPASSPLVSVMAVSYNQRAFVEEALESAILQDYPNLQVVVSDDASTDGTDRVIARLAERYPDRLVAILNDRNVGVTRNCNVALARCTGEYVAFLAGDDLFLPGKIAAQVAWLEERRERVLCGHQVEVFYDDGTPSHPFQRILRHGSGAADVIRFGAYAACSIMVRRSALPPSGFDDRVPIVSDYLLWVEVLAGGGEFGYVPGVWGRYRRHDANVSGDVLANVADAERALELIEQRYPQYRDACRRARARFVHFPVGRHLLRNGRRSEARAALLQAIRTEPRFPRPWLELARTFA